MCQETKKKLFCSKCGNKIEHDYYPRWCFSCINKRRHELEKQHPERAKKKALKRQQIIKDYLKDYRNRESSIIKRKERVKKSIEELNDNYIKMVIRRNQMKRSTIVLLSKEIPKELIEAKRIQIKSKRDLKEMK